MSFDTKHLIAEIQNRPCLWKTTDEYSNLRQNRVIRQSAWNKIAETLFNDWRHLEETTRVKRVQDLQKKWKGLRDYYTREKSKEKKKKKKMKESSLKTGKEPQKKRKTPFLDMLQFLNAIKGSNATSSIPDEIEETSSENSQSAQKGKNLTVLQDTLLKPTMGEMRENDPDMSFLYNILPEMKSMTPAQNFDFRFEVMKLIKRIKYNNYYVCPPEQQSYPCEFDYRSGVNFSNTQDIPSASFRDEEQSPSQESVASSSSVEDKKAILQSCPGDNDSDLKDSPDYPVHDQSRM